MIADEFKELKIKRLTKLIDLYKWGGVLHGIFHYSIIEREKYWSYDDDVEFQIACELKRLLNG